MPSAPVSQHMRKCRTAVSVEATTILASTSRSEAYRLTLEALYIEDRRPQINTKDEFRSRTLTIVTLTFRIVIRNQIYTNF